MEDSNSTSNFPNDETSTLASIDHWFIYSIALAITVVVVVVLIMRDCDKSEELLQRIEELERRKTCPKRRKRAFYKLIETKKLTRGECDKDQTSSCNDHSAIIMRENNNECPICLEVFDEGQNLSMSKDKICHHVFHSECLELWLRKHDDCPCCRVIFIDESTLLEDEEGTKVVPKKRVKTTGGDDNNV